MTEDDERPLAQPQTVPARLAELAELLAGESTRSRRFLGGLVVGALVGAAATGLAALRRRSNEPGAPPRSVGRGPEER